MLFNSGFHSENTTHYQQGAILKSTFVHSVDSKQRIYTAENHEIACIETSDEKITILL